MDHYKTLGVSDAATKLEIKEAFRRSALKFHPDRHAKSSEESRDAAAVRFRQANEAYEVLSDDRRRAEYDLSRGSRVFGRRHGGPSSYYSAGYGGGGSYGYQGGGGHYHPPPPPKYGSGSRFDAAVLFRYITTRQFIVNVVFACALLGGVSLIDKSVEDLWKMNNSGKTFEDALESVEKLKIQKEKS